MFRRYRYRRGFDNLTLPQFLFLSGVVVLGSYSPRSHDNILILVGLALIALAIVIWFFQNSPVGSQNTSEKRKEALRQAAPFLSPYKNIWKDLKLSNKYCILRLGKDGSMIVAKEKVEPYRRFRIVSSKVHGYKDLWEMFCLAFSHNLTYDMLIELCDTYQLTIIEENVPIAPPQKQELNSSKKEVLKPTDDLEKIDINNRLIAPREEEIKVNPPSRSAKLRIARRINKVG